MIRVLTVVALSSLAFSCSGWKTIERGEWEVVWTKENAEKDAEAKVKMMQGYGGYGQEVVTSDTYEGELTEGHRRKVEPLAGVRPAKLPDLDGMCTLGVGELRTFRVDESKDPVITWTGSVLEVYLTQAKRIDGWKGDEAVDGRESYLHVVGTKPGKAKLQLVEGTEKFLVEVTVTAKKKD